MRSQKVSGFTLVEVMVSMAILLIAFVAALGIMGQVDRGQASNVDSLGFASGRNQIVSLLIDDTSWGQMVAGPGASANPQFSCLLKQDSSATSDRTCPTTPAPLVIYNIKGASYVINGVTAYDFRMPNQGISNKGQPCNTFNAAANSGDPNCPYQVVVTSKPICANAACANPAILFTGTTVFNGGPNQVNPNVANLSFQLIKSRIYCPPALNPGGQTTAAATLDVSSATQVKSTLMTNVATTDKAVTDTIMAPCRKVLVSFSEDLAAGFINDPNNSSSVSLRDEGSGTEVFEFRRIVTPNGYDYKIYVNGVVVVAGKPSWVTLTQTTTFRFDITNGLLRFCVDDRCPHYFTQKVDFPFRAVFRPASGFFTPNGLNSINYTLLDQ